VGKTDAIFAIDFGTSNSLVAAATIAGPLPPARIDLDAGDQTLMKTILYTPKHQEWFFGAKAISEYGQNLAHGRIFKSIKKYLPDPAFEGTVIHERRYNLSELVAVFLKEIRQRAGAYYGFTADKVLIGRPALFSHNPDHDALAEKRLSVAARLAGFTEVRFCPEPVAAAYEFRSQLASEKLVLIADFGGGTSDFTVVRMGPERFGTKDLLAIGGLSVAGDRFDGAIMKYFISPHFGTKVRYKMPTGSNSIGMPMHIQNRLCSPADISFLARNDITSMLRDFQRWALDQVDAQKLSRLFVLVEDHLGYQIFKNIEATKVALSTAPRSEFHFSYPEVEVREEVTAVDFRANSDDLVKEIVKELDRTLELAGVKAKDIDIVCCTGGTAQLPALQAELTARFGDEKLRQHRHFHSIINGLADKAHAWCAET